MPNNSANPSLAAYSATHLRHPLHPDLHVFKRETGGWYAGFHRDGYYFRKATRSQLLPVALDSAREWYLDQHAALRLGLTKPPARHSVREASKLALNRLQASVDRKERSAKYLAGIRLLLDSDLLPFFGDLDVKDVGIKKWSEYETNVESRKLTRQTLHQHRNALRVCLNEAVRQEWIERLPTLKIDKIGKAQQQPRVWFEPAEFRLLLRVARNHVKMLADTRWSVDGEECYDFIVWMANTGMRVGEVRNVRICDVEVHVETASDGEQRPFCLVKNIRGKRGTGECRSWYEAYSAYQRILLRRGISQPATCTESLFLVHHRDMFNAILDKAGLKFTPTEPRRRRDFVSLRHTYIAFRLLQGVPVYDIARNCRTSVAMIENHYARYISPRLLTDLNRFKPVQQPSEIFAV
jgi:integrase